MPLLDARAADFPSLPGVVPLPEDEPWTGNSSMSLSIIEGPTLNLWSYATVVKGKTQGELTLQLQPDRAVVIGRQEGGQIEYLDPSYQPTRMLPNSQKPVVTTLHRDKDLCVSRGHFMLKGSRAGIVLINGVPRRGGGVRPPKNGTLLVAPVHRPLGDGEEYTIASGASATIRLPNGTVLMLRAE